MDDFCDIFYEENNEDQYILFINYVKLIWDEDDEWWDVVECEVVQLEMNILICKFFSWFF